MTERQPASEIPVFSPRLDEVMAAMLKGTAPNAGRFCGYCYTPLGKRSDECGHCGHETAAYVPLPKLPRGLFELYSRMRKRESLIVNAFAFAGLALGLLLFVVLVAIVVYRYEQSLWLLAAATFVLFVTGRVFAGILGGWVGDTVGYNYARRKLIDEWTEYERLGRPDSAPPGAPPAAAVDARGG